MTEMIKCAYHKCENMFVPNKQAGTKYCSKLCSGRAWREAHPEKLLAYNQKYLGRNKERKRHRRRTFGQRRKQVYAPRPKKTPFEPILFQRIDSPDRMIRAVHDMFVDINVKALLKQACEAGRKFRKGR